MKEFDPMQKPTLDVSSYVFPTEDKAWDIVVRLQDFVMVYGHCKVADFKDVVGGGITYADTVYGWPDLQDADVEKGTFGYHLVLPDFEYVGEGY